MKTSELGILLQYPFHDSVNSRSPVFRKKFKAILRLLCGLKPETLDKTDVVWQCPWLRTEGRKTEWHRVTVQLYNGTAYVGFGARNSWNLNLGTGLFGGINIGEERKGFDPGGRFMRWFLAALEKEIKRFLAGPEKYNHFVEKSLPYRFRVGKILRKNLWVKKDEKYFVRDELRSKGINEFEQTVRDCLKPALQKEMTSGEFLRLCALAYDAIFPKERRLTPLEKYRRHADGRDDGLLDLDSKDPEAFRAWMKSNRFGGHPWEVVRGGNSTHIDLAPMEAESGGWQIFLRGHSTVCAAQTIKMANALHRAGIRLELAEKDYLLQMARGEDWVGIVPEDTDTTYCHSLFEEYGDRILGFMHLGESERNKSIFKKIQWYPHKPFEAASASLRKELLLRISSPQRRHSSAQRCTV